jgi:CDP-diacylglycerol--serine O-phosphatidyltransferase
MADMVTFGVVPAFIAVELVGAGVPFVSDSADHYFGRATLVIALIYVACAALRLARYTVAASEKHAVDPSVFTGLPSPGAAGTVAALALLHQHVLHGSAAIADDSWVVDAARFGMVGVTLLTALAMVSKLPYTHVMNRYLRERAKVGTVAAYVIVGLLLLIAPQWTLAFGFVAYALSSPGWWVWKKIRPQSSSH